MYGDNSKVVQEIKETPGCEKYVEILEQFAKKYPDYDPFEWGAACMKAIDFEKKQLSF